MADTSNPRRSTRLNSQAPSLAPTLQSTTQSVRRSPMKRPAAATRLAAGSTTSTARTRPASTRGQSLATAETRAPPPRNPAVTSVVAAELEEHHARYSNAYGSPGQAAEPERLANSRIKNTAGDALKAAVAEAKQNKASALQHQIEPETESESESEVENEAEAESEPEPEPEPEPSIVSKRSKGSVQSSAISKVESSNGSKSTRRSSARNFAAVGSANFIAKGASISGSSASSARLSKTSTPASQEVDSRRSDASTSSLAPASPPAPIAPEPWFSCAWISWFTPFVWLRSFANWAVAFASQAARLSQRALAAIWTFLLAFAPLFLAVSLLLAISLLSWEHVKSPTLDVTLLDRLAAPFHVKLDPPVPVSVGSQPSVPDMQATAACTNCDARLKVVEQAIRHPVPARRQQEPLRKVNFFAPGSGVTVDPYLTSPSLPMLQFGKQSQPYRPVLARLTFGLLDSWYRQPGPSPSSIFLPWEDMGECWCASESDGKAQIGIVLSGPMAPQELVVEHMPASGLLRAQMDATPKDVEMWVQIEDKNVRAAVQAAALDIVNPTFSDGRSVHGSLPSSTAASMKTRQSLDDTWVRIGRFRYQLGGPQSQSFKIHVDMVALGAPIHRLAVRTLNSWGEDGTAVCLYRMKLHGAVVEEVKREAGK